MFNFLVFFLLTYVIYALIGDDLIKTVVFNKDKKFSLTLHKFIDFSYKPLIIIILYFVGFSKNPILTVLGCVIILMVSLIGLVLKHCNYVVDCKCFGNLLENKYIGIANCVLMVVAVLVIYLVIEDLTSASLVNSYGNLYVLLTSMVAAIFFRGFQEFKNKSQKDNNLKKSNSEDLVKPFLENSAVIGVNFSGRSISIKDVARGKPILIVGMTKNCDACEALKSVIFDISAAFKNHVDTIITFDDEAQVSKTDLSDEDKILVASTQFNRDLGIDGFPYALIVNPVNFQHLSPIVYGPSKIWTLFYMATRISKR